MTCKLSKSEAGKLGFIASRKTQINQKNHRIAEYNKNPKTCNQCGKSWSYDEALIKKKYCNQSCAAKYNNSRRKHSNETKERMSKSHIKIIKDIGHYPKRWDKLKKYIDGEYSMVWFRTCSTCITLFTAKDRYISKCQCCVEQYGRTAKELQTTKRPYYFKFDVNDYPNLLNLDLIKKHGWYVPKKNSNGVARDHKISINESIVNKYDPYYITHPLNCEIMLQKDNVKKRNTSSITYKQLKLDVDEYEKTQLHND